MELPKLATASDVTQTWILGKEVYLTKPQATEVIRRAEAYEELVRLGKGFVEISEEVLKDVMVNVELAYKFQAAKDVFKQAIGEPNES